MSLRDKALLVLRKALESGAACPSNLLPLLLLLVLPAVVQAQFNYTSTSGSITITGYTGPGGAVTIPSTINGLPVTSIGAFAFSSCTNLASVTIPNSVTSIGDAAFIGCTSLTSVTIPDSVTSIGWAFDGCLSLRAITVDTHNPIYSSADGVLFNKSQNTLIQCPGGKAGSYTIPNSVTSIGVFAFSLCTNLSSVTIPNSVTSIGDGAFIRCTSLTSVTLGNSVATIGSWAFYYCTRLTNLAIPNSVTSIGDGAFGYSTNLTSVTIPNLVNNMGDLTFEFCTSLTSVTIGNSVTSIGLEAFIGCTNLTSVTIGDSVTYIGGNAFSCCTNLTSVTIPGSVSSIGGYAFNDCPRLTGVYFLGNAPSADSTVFQGDPATIYHLPGTTGWGAMFGGRPTAFWPLPTIQTSPLTQTAEAGSAVGLRVKASGPLLFCLWYFNYTNLISYSTDSQLQLTNVQFSQAGAYTAVITNAAGAVTSSPALLNVIAAVEHRPIPGVKVTGAAASLLNVDYADSLSPAPTWATLGSVSLTSTSPYYFDLTLPLPAQRYYRAWQMGAPGVIPSLELHLVPAITLTGTIGHSVRVEAINQVGPTEAWFTLDTVTLTNTSQLYFDTSAWGQPQRLYRLLPIP